MVRSVSPGNRAQATLVWTHPMTGVVEARRVAKRRAKRVARLAAKKAAKPVARKAAKPVAKKAVRPVARKVVRRAVKKAVKPRVKKAARKRRAKKRRAKRNHPAADRRGLRRMRLTCATSCLTHLVRFTKGQGSWFASLYQNCCLPMGTCRCVHVYLPICINKNALQTIKRIERKTSYGSETRVTKFILQMHHLKAWAKL